MVMRIEATTAPKQKQKQNNAHLQIHQQIHGQRDRNQGYLLPLCLRRFSVAYRESSQQYLAGRLYNEFG